MDVTIYFNDQIRPVTVKVDDESLYNLLPPKMDSQLIRPQFHPQDFLGGSHVQSQHHLDARINYGTLIP